MTIVFGDQQSFAIEIGAVETYATASGIFVQFRFWVGGVPIGDWDDRISLSASVHYATVVVEYARLRFERSFEGVPAVEAFQKVYDSFYNHDYTKEPAIVPNLRDRFHLDGVGMGAIDDKYGIVLLSNSFDFGRVIVKDLRVGTIIVDILISSGVVEEACREYITWGQQLM